MRKGLTPARITLAATLALATDYDCWHEEDEVSVEQILKIISQNVRVAQEIIRRAVDHIPDQRTCSCSRALENAVLTNRKDVTPAAAQRLSLILDKYWQ